MTVAQKNEDQRTPAELASQGWKRCFIADEPRLSEAVETYVEIGYEVTVVPVPQDDEGCTECIAQDSSRYRLIFIRKR